MKEPKQTIAIVLIQACVLPEEAPGFNTLHATSRLGDIGNAELA